MAHGPFHRRMGKGEELVIVDHLTIGSTRMRSVVVMVGVYLEWSSWNLHFVKGKVEENLQRFSIRSQDYEFRDTTVEGLGSWKM